MPELKKHILILPKWYPNPDDLQLGIFIQNQANLISDLYHVTVLYVQSSSDCAEPYSIEKENINGVHEIRVHYKQSRFFEENSKLF